MQQVATVVWLESDRPIQRWAWLLGAPVIVECSLDQGRVTELVKLAGHRSHHSPFEASVGLSGRPILQAAVPSSASAA